MHMSHSLELEDDSAPDMSALHFEVPTVETLPAPKAGLIQQQPEALPLKRSQAKAKPVAVAVRKSLKRPSAAASQVPLKRPASSKQRGEKPYSLCSSREIATIPKKLEDTFGFTQTFVDVALSFNPKTSWKD